MGNLCVVLPYRGLRRPNEHLCLVGVTATHTEKKRAEGKFDNGKSRDGFTCTVCHGGKK